MWSFEAGRPSEQGPAEARETFGGQWTFRAEVTTGKVR